MQRPQSTLKRLFFALFPFWAHEWAHLHSTHLSRFLGAQAALVAPDALVLDAGAGPVKYREIFGRARYLACDMVSTTPTEFGIDWTRLDAVADIQALPFSTASMDAVLVLEVLEHLAQPDRLLAEAHRVLKPGGRLVVTVPFLYPEHFVPHDHHRFTRYGLEGHLAGNGFTVETFETIEGFATTMALLLRSCLVEQHQFRPWLSKNPTLLRLYALLQRLFIGPLVWLARKLDRTSWLLPQEWSRRYLCALFVAARRNDVPFTSA